jgi:hypothetical protein
MRKSNACGPIAIASSIGIDAYLSRSQRLHAGFVRRPREPVGVEGLGEDFDAVGISGREVRLNAGAEGNAGRQQALVREQHHDPLRLGRRGIRSEEHQNRERDQPWHRAPA